MPYQALRETRDDLREGTRELAADAVRDVRNARASLRIFIISTLVAILMGVAGWAFLLALRMATEAVSYTHLTLPTT